MKVAIYGQSFPGNDINCVIELLDELEKVNAKVAIESDFLSLIKDVHSIKEHDTYTLSKGLDNSFDMFVSFGGDGTMLRAVTYVRDLDIPIVGVNTGRLGFLSCLLYTSDAADE